MRCNRQLTSLNFSDCGLAEGSVLILETLLVLSLSLLSPSLWLSICASHMRHYMYYTKTHEEHGSILPPKVAQ